MLSPKALAKLYLDGGLLARLRDANGDVWRRYIDHEFVQRLGDGSLPEPAFRRYLIQDYLFLIHLLSGSMPTPAFAPKSRTAAITIRPSPAPRS
jgi:thiaminase